MYIVPNSDVHLIKNCPFDADYENTGYFTSRASQLLYFFSFNTSGNLISLTEYSYQRKDRGYIRVGLPYSDVYNVNYMMFRNYSFENKWWFAFVDSVEYINDSVTELHYRIDVIQTWLLDAHFTQTFIERQHSRSDAIGDNIVDENLAMGEYKFCDYKRLEYGGANKESTRMATIVAVADVNQASVAGTYHGGIYSGATLTGFFAEDVSTIDTFLSAYIQRPDAVVGIYSCPLSAVPVTLTMGTPVTITSSGWSYHYYNGTPVDDTMYIDKTYKPVNNKLYTYPYNYLIVNNTSGEGNIYRYEFFDNLTPKFVIYDTIAQPVTVKLFPNGYKNVSFDFSLLDPTTWDFENNPVLTNEGLALTGYPLSSWNMDSYKAWIAQQSLSGRELRRGAQALLGEMTNSLDYNGGYNNEKITAAYPNIYTGVVEGLAGFSKLPLIGKFFNVFNEEYKASIAADIFKGTLANNNVDVANKNMCFNIGRMSITAQRAREIDNFFTMYGYAQKKLGLPDLDARTKWTFIKTIGCHIDGSIPADDKLAIEGIFDNGIRFWKDPSQIGDYTLTNDPII